MNALRISYSDENVVEYDLIKDFTHEEIEACLGGLRTEKNIKFHLKDGVLFLPPIIWSQCIIEFFDKRTTEVGKKIKVGPVIDQVS